MEDFQEKSVHDLQVRILVVMAGRDQRGDVINVGDFADAILPLHRMRHIEFIAERSAKSGVG